MAVLWVVAGLFVGAMVLKAGSVAGADAAFMFRLIALPVFAGVITLALWLHHRRKSHELIVARYHLKGDALGWRRMTLAPGQKVRVCPDCGAPAHDYEAQEEHAGHHQQIWELQDQVKELQRMVAEKLGGGPREEPKAVPWTADAAPPETVSTGAVEVTQDALESAPGVPEDDRFTRFRHYMERING